MRKKQLLFSLGVIMAVTDNVSTERVLFPARLIRACVRGLPPSAISHNGCAYGHDEFYGLQME